MKGQIAEFLAAKLDGVVDVAKKVIEKNKKNINIVE